MEQQPKASKQRQIQQRMFELIRQQQDTQQSVRLFCSYHQISQACYYYWLRKYRNGQAQQTAGGEFTLVHPESGDPGSVFWEWIRLEDNFHLAAWAHSRCLKHPVR